MEADDLAPLVWLIAGEPSGDLLGARLMAALREQTGGRIRLAGIGGEQMTAQGLNSRFPISDITVMGMAEVLPRIRLIRRRIDETAAQILGDRPDVVVSIDSPGFCYRVWKKLVGRGIPLIHYVAPTVWIWKPERARKFARLLDHLMVVLPFEPPYFQKEGLACTFVGHPVVEEPDGRGDGGAFRKAHGISRKTKIICVLPGSRRSEVVRLLPAFRDAAERVSRQTPGVVYCFPTLPFLDEIVQSGTARWPSRAIVVTSAAERRDAMAASDVAMAASGTVSLELARAAIPHVVAYRVHGVTATLFRVMQKGRLRYANLVNILLDREAIPEFLQQKCRGDRIAAAVTALLETGAAASAQKEAASQALGMLRAGSRAPSLAAAAIVLAHAYGQVSRGAGVAQTDENTDGETA